MADRIVSWGGFDSKSTSGMGVTGSLSVTSGITAGGTIITDSETAFRSNGITNNTYSRYGIFSFQGWQTGTQTALFNGWNQVSYINSPLNIGLASEAMPARLRVRGSGTTSSTTTLLIENANTSASFQVKDNSEVVFATPDYSPTDQFGTFSFLSKTRTGIYIANTGNNYGMSYEGGQIYANIGYSNQNPKFTPGNNRWTTNADFISQGTTTSNNFYLGTNGGYFSTPSTGTDLYAVFAGSTSASGQGRILMYGETHNPKRGKLELYSGTDPVYGVISFSPGNTEAARFTPDGRLNIGAITGSAKLNVSGSSNFAGNMIITGSATNSLTVKGSGATSSTTSLLVQDSNGSSAFEVKDDRSATIYGPLTLGRANTGYIYAAGNNYIALPRQGGAAPGYLSNSDIGDGWSMISPAGEYLRVRESGLGFPNGGITYQEYSGYGYGRNTFRIYYTGSFTTTTLILKGDRPVAYAAGLNLLVAGGNSGTYENVDSKGAPGSVTVEGGSATSSSFTTHVPAGGVNIQTGLGLGTGSAADLTFSTSTTSSVASTYHTQTQRMIIKGQTGFVGIGTSSPSASLHVSGSSIFTNTVTISGSNAAVTMPSRPAFRVTGSGTMTNLTTTQNGDGTLNQNNWVIDYQQGSALTGSTGVFTAPLAGLYQISLVGRNSGYSSGISQLAVVKYSGASSAVQIMVEWASSSTMNHTGGSSITYMNVGDTLKLKVLAGEINFDGNDNWSVAYIG